MSVSDKRGERTVLAVTVLMLVLFGLVMVLSVTQGSARDPLKNPLFVRQVLWAGCALVAFAVSSQVPYEWFGRLRWPLLLAAVGLLAAVLVPGVGLLRNHARRWIGLGVVTFQPSEFAKLALVVFLATLCAKPPTTIADHRKLLLVGVLVTGLLAGLVLLEPDFGTAAILAAIGGFMLYMGQVRLRYLAALAVAALAAAVPLVVTSPYRLKRVVTFLQWESDPTGAGYHIRQSLIALGSGGVSGLGLGASRQKYAYVPEAQTDFIYAIIGEETGLIGTLGILVLFAILFLCAARIAQSARDRFGAMLAMGIGALITLQAMVNMAVVTALVPTKGLALPLISRGGTSLVFSMIMIGTLYNVSQRSQLPETVE